MAPGELGDDLAVDDERADAAPIGERPGAGNDDVYGRRIGQLEKVGDDAAGRLRGLEIEVELVVGRREMDLGVDIALLAVVAGDVEHRLDRQRRWIGLQRTLGGKFGNAAAGKLPPERDLRQVDLSDVDRNRQAGRSALRRLLAGLRQPRQFDALGAKAVGVEIARQERRRRPVERHLARHQPRPGAVFEHNVIQSQRTGPDAFDAADGDPAVVGRSHFGDQAGEILPAAFRTGKHHERADRHHKQQKQRVKADAKDAPEDLHRQNAWPMPA